MSNARMRGHDVRGQARHRSASAHTLVAEQLLAAKGDREATDRLIRALYPRLQNRIRRRLTRYPVDLIEDAVQEAVVRVLTYLPMCRAESDGQLVRWALLLGWHAALRYVRSTASGSMTGWDAIPLHELADGSALAIHPREEWTGSVADASATELADGPVVIASGELLVALLAAACAEEGHACLQLVLERAAFAQSYKEIAAARGISVGAAKRRYQRTIARLRRAVQERAFEVSATVDGSVRRRVIAIVTAGADGRDDARARA